MLLFNIRLLGDYSRPKPQRVFDEFLMDELLPTEFTTAEIEKINRCRLYLQVLTVADLANGAGDHIDMDLYNGKRSAQRHSTYK